jgi:dipeptidase E
MATIIAMGGGAELEADQVAMRRLMVAETGKERPNVLYIPPDGGADEGFWPVFRERMEALGCLCKPMLLLREPEVRLHIRKLVNDADLIFVGGGNTLRMMRMWRRFGLDRALADVANSDKVFAGVSAGAICWFEYGHSDSRSFSGKANWQYIRVRGLGILSGTFCPHVLAENRMHNFESMMRKVGGTGYGVNDGSALLVKTGVAEVIGQYEAFRVTRRGAEPLTSPFLI